MKRIGYTILGTLALTAVIATSAFAHPTVTGALVKPRIFNDCPISTLTVTNAYPSLISISDQNLLCFGFANLHVWHLVDATNADQIFDNASCFRLACDMVLSGTGDGEGGLQVAPWWSIDADGLFNVRTTDGEIACFGGRLPFFSFTSAVVNPPYSLGYGLHYVKGTPIHLEVIYHPNDLSASNPATIEYIVGYGGNTYSSGLRAFDQGNPSEDPPHGQWGMLNVGAVGGHYKAFLGQGNPVGLTATWTNIFYETCDAPTPTQQTTWGRVKSLYR